MKKERLMLSPIQIDFLMVLNETWPNITKARKRLGISIEQYEKWLWLDQEFRRRISGIKCMYREIIEAKLWKDAETNRLSRRFLLQTRCPEQWGNAPKVQLNYNAKKWNDC